MCWVPVGEGVEPLGNITGGAGCATNPVPNGMAFLLAKKPENSVPI